MMNHIFELPHIFIVFQPGTSGNFVSGILSKIINNNISDLQISNNGSSHTTIDRKIAGTDYLSFGTAYKDQLVFSTQETREAYYLENIEKINDEITTPQVIWTHDFTNITLYQKFFPNSKILVITQNSNLEKLVAVCMNVTKNLVDPNFIAPFPPKQWEYIIKNLDVYLEYGLKNIVGDRSKDIVKNKFDNDNHDIVKFVRTQQMLMTYGLLHLVDTSFPASKDLTNTVLFWTPENKTSPHKIGLGYDSYITNDCIQLPYSYLIEGRANLLVDAIESTVGNLTDSQRIYIAVQFNKYRDMQDQVMLTDPYKYFSDLKNTVFKK